ncbi:glutaredoxin 3 [Isachenkonia alkalipeptolytica]|uniref:Glutaredoxin n=1 Tax=Isachenkonia alkalipeptolytica TaxID=2565777 RepID=A0AA44BF34_9CLOT|nr:glutaredoxin 3 [Isachenkonia alkalipeptolytica]NBG89637.1 glutaredoxin 3 [Isachenkonia alkalipeptolytica]
MKPVKVYSKSYCPFCHKAIQLLEEKNINVEIIDITGDEDRMMTLSSETNCDTVPQIFIGDDFIGGCDELMALEETGELEKLLEG